MKNLLFKFTTKSSNKKTGPIPTTITSHQTCPSSCPFQGQGCYAESGPLKLWWDHINNERKHSITLEKLCEKIKSLPKNTFWRHNVAGDLPGDDTRIDASKLTQIVKANKGKKGFTYTHKPVTPTKGVGVDTIYKNKNLIKLANTEGFTINLSANNVDEADKLQSLKIAPVVTVVDSNTKEDFVSKGGNYIKICPAVISDKTCDTCRLCYKRKRKSIVAFPAHGSKKKHVNKTIQKNVN